MVVPVSSKWPSATRAITSNSQFPLKVYNNEVVLLQGNLRYDARPGESPVSVEPGALAAIIIQGNITLNGARASGTTGATAAIHVPASSSLTIYSAEDQSRSTDRSAPAYSLTVTGGSGGYGGYDLDKAHPRGCHRDIFRVLGPGRRNGLQRIRDGERPAERHAGPDADQARTGLFASLTGNGCVKDFTILPTGVMPHDYATLSDLFTFTVTLAK